MFQSSSLGGSATGNGPPLVAAVDADRDLLDVAQQPLLHHVDARRKRSLIAPLLRADEEHLVLVLLAGVADELVFFERERERLLAEDVLAGLQGLDGDLHVPVVGRDDAHHVDVLAIEHLAIVAVERRPCLCRFLGRSWPSRRGRDRHRRRRRYRQSRLWPCASPVPMLPTPMQPIRGRSFFATLANAAWVQGMKGAAAIAAPVLMNWRRFEFMFAPGDLCVRFDCTVARGQV